VARVVACSECLPFTHGALEFEVEADTVRRLIDELDARFPGLGEFIDRRMAVAIDGEIHQNAWFSPIGPDSEIHLIPKIGGG
jgi:molybdopterin converting factor small subunit